MNRLHLRINNSEKCIKCGCVLLTGSINVDDEKEWSRVDFNCEKLKAPEGKQYIPPVSSKY